MAKNSCYCSPNSGWDVYVEFVKRLEVSIKISEDPVVIAGDFNAHSPHCGSPEEDKRGSLLADTIAANNLSVCNVGNAPTFVRQSSRTHIDVAFASDKVMQDIKRWRVLDEETLSQHRYILFDIDARAGNRVAATRISQAGRSENWTWQN